MVLETSSQSTRGSDHQEMESSMQIASSHDSHMEADKGKVIMDEELWKDFLPDLYVEILAAFPIIKFCRLRTISREWNDLAEHLVSLDWSFIMEMLEERPQTIYMFRTPKALDLGVGSAENLVRPSWEVYDPNLRYCFPLNMQFLNTKDEFGRLCRVEDGCITVAADKGFICVAPNYHSEYIKVVNPMTGCIVELPPLLGTERSPFYNRVVSLVVADDYSAFSLYVIQARVHDTTLSKRFDSNVGAWRELPQPPATMWASHILHMDSTLFTLFWDEDDAVAHLYFLDTTTTHSVWHDTGVELLQEVEILQLATTLGRLFFAMLLVDKIELMEVDVRTFSCTVVASMDKSHEFYEERKWVDEWSGGDHAVFQIVVVGCRNFIVFSSVSGASVAYDLLNSKWCEWIQSMKEVRDVDCYSLGLYGTSMSLTLNPVPAVHISI